MTFIINYIVLNYIIHKRLSLGINDPDPKGTKYHIDINLGAKLVSPLVFDRDKTLEKWFQEHKVLSHIGRGIIIPK